MFDQLRDLMSDERDLQVRFATKRLWLNRGITMMWPRIYVMSEDTSILTADDETDYALPQEVTDGYITSVEISVPDTTDYVRLGAYDIVDGDEDLDGVFRFTGIYPGDDRTVRIRYAAPLPLIASGSYIASESETWVGPDRAMQAPVFYAMSMIAARKLDNRQDVYRYSTTQATNGVSDMDIMDASRFWMNQFELEVENMARVLPIAKD